MTKVALICDSHFGVRNDSPVFHEYFRQSLKFFFDYLDEHKITTVIHLGDLFDRRKYVNFLTAKVCREEFLLPLYNRKITTHIITGNHDLFYKNTHEVNAFDEIVGNRYEPHIKTYSSPHLLEIEGCQIQLIPWICESNKEQSYDAIKNTTSDIVIGHFELNGFEMFNGVVSDHGEDREMFSRFDLVFSGHYHHKSSKGNIHYLGAFAEYTWSDYNDPRGFTIFDTETRTFEFVRNPYSIFKVVAYDDVKHADIIQKIQATDYSKHKNCYVKVIVINRTNPYAFDMLIDKLYKANPIDISVIEDVSTLVDNDENGEVDQTQDTPTILTKYIKGLTLNVDNDKMVRYMKDVYTEALSVEHLE